MSDQHGAPFEPPPPRQHPQHHPPPAAHPRPGRATYQNPTSGGPLTFPWQPRPATEPPPPPRLPATPPPGRHRDLRLLRTAYRRLRRVATLTALGYFTLLLLLSAYAPSLMTRGGPAGLSTGLLLMLCQLPVTLLALLVYEAHARKRVDPLAHRLRRRSRTQDAP